jgi:hypothetical protein
MNSLCSRDRRVLVLLARMRSARVAALAKRRERVGAMPFASSRPHTDPIGPSAGSGARQFRRGGHKRQVFRRVLQCIRRKALDDRRLGKVVGGS